MRYKISRARALSLAALLAVICFGIFLWAKDSGRSLVNDELWTVYFSSTRHLKTAGDMFAYIARMPAVNPPLHPLLIRFWIALFGDGEWALRIPSLIFAACSLFVMFRLTAKLFHPKAAFVACVLLLFAYPFAYFADVARNYSLFFLLSLLSAYYFLSLLDGWRKKTAVLYLVSTALLLYCHYFGFFFLLAHLLTLAVMRKVDRRWLMLFAGMCILYLPWVPSFFYHAQRLRYGSWVPRVGIADGLHQMLVFFGIAGWGWVGIAPLAFAMAGLVALWRHRSRASFIVFWIATPIAVPLLISQFTQPFFVTRFMLPALAPLVIIYALGLCEYIKNKYFLTAAVAAFALFIAFPAPLAPPPLEQEDWKTAFQVLAAKQQSAIVVNPVSTATRMAVEYYGKPETLISETALGNACPPNVSVLSRYETYRINSPCGYRLEKRYLDLPPFVFEYRRK